MKNVSKLLGALFAVLFLSSQAQAQISVTYSSGGWGYRPGVTVSVGNNRGYYDPSCDPYYRPRYRRRAPRRRHYNRGYYQSNSAYWCQPHQSYCTHGYVQQNCNQAYWCQPHQMYCTHR